MILEIRGRVPGAERGNIIRICIMMNSAKDCFLYNNKK